MEIVIRGIITYVLLFILFRVCGKRAISEATPFGLILIFLVSSSVADALKDDDRSMTGGFLLAMTLLLTHLAFSYIKLNSRRLKRIIDDVPTLLVKDGEPIKERMRKAMVTEEDV